MHATTAPRPGRTAPARPLRRTWPLLALLALQGAVAQPARATEASLHALLTDTRMAEISGMAVSRRHAGVLWVHNDSDDDARLLAMDDTGKVVGALTIAGVRNVDWEDLAAFRWQDRDWLLVADTGDNGGVRSTLDLLVVAEPEALSADATVEPSWRIRFAWPDGARDCEAVAVDAEAGLVYLVAKKRVPPEVWTVPLQPSADAVATASLVGTLAGVVQPSSEDLARNPVYGRYRSQVTAADITADGLHFAALNYRTAYLFSRRPGEPWAAAFARQPRELTLPWLPQAEALAFDPAGEVIWITSEKLPAPLLRLPVPPPPKD